MGLQDPIGTEGRIWMRGDGGRETVNKNEDHDYYSLVSAVSPGIQDFAKQSGKGVLVITDRAHHFSAVQHFLILPTFQISSMVLGIWRLLRHSHGPPGMYHLIGETSRCTKSYLCNSESTRVVTWVRYNENVGGGMGKGAFWRKWCLTQSRSRSRTYPSAFGTGRRNSLNKERRKI